MAMNQGQSQSDFILEVAGCFEPGGALSKATADFVSRDSQRAFAITVAEAIESTGTVVVEAGTGTGKTFAYLTRLVSHCRISFSPRTCPQLKGHWAVMPRLHC